MAYSGPFHIRWNGLNFRAILMVGYILNHTCFLHNNLIQNLNLIYIFSILTTICRFVGLYQTSIFQKTADGKLSSSKTPECPRSSTNRVWICQLDTDRWTVQPLMSTPLLLQVQTIHIFLHTIRWRRNLLFSLVYVGVYTFTRKSLFRRNKTGEKSWPRFKTALTVVK